MTRPLCGIIIAMVVEISKDGTATARLATALKALGEPTRLKMLQFLASSCRSLAIGEAGEVRPMNGPTMGEVCCYVTGFNKVTSTISHHLKELRIAGLVEVEKRGRYVVCSVDRGAVAEIAGFLNEIAAGHAPCEECE